ncbi:MAG: class I tRNA ligase family protein [Planctomycetota bacterium]
MPDDATTQASPIAAHRYTARLAGEIETRWQRLWAESAAFRCPNPGDPGFDASRDKFFVLDMFPYPSGAGLHVGHPEGYTATDILGRYKKMTGHNVLHVMGWDAFGLPAEQHAINTGEHPATFTRGTIDTFRRQLQMFGFAYDWSREVATIDEDFYRWTQWIFLQIYDSWFDPWQKKARPIADLIAELENGDLRIGVGGDLVHVGRSAKALRALGGEAPTLRAWHELDDADQRTFIDERRLAYIGEQTVNWCPKLGTVLANEEVIDGRSERGGHPVFRKPLRQWMLRITAYAERLLAGLEDLDWPEDTRTKQRNWIGRSEGAEIDFALDVDTEDPDIDADLPPALRVFTTRPDTVFGATFMVIAPEHPVVDAVLGTPRPETPADDLRRYVDEARNKADVDRQAAKDKTGVFTGLYAINPATGDRVPVWVADYVLMGYGYGAIMAVPAHDERDFEFARAFDLPIRDVVYSVPVSAMAYYARHATEAEIADGDKWTQILADLLGYVTANELTPRDFDHALTHVRINRRGERPVPDDRAAHAAPPPADAGAPGAAGTRRGVVQMTWLETIESDFANDFETLRSTFEGGAFYARRGQAYPGQGFAARSTAEAEGYRIALDGLPTATAMAQVGDWLEATGIGRRRVNYKLRDWLFSRQRYWGEPFPVVFTEDGNHYPLDASALPLTLPDVADYLPEESEEPRPLLAKASDWVRTTAGQAGCSMLASDTPVSRETNTMPGWAGSCWYYLRYADPKNDQALCSREAQAYWLGDRGVDLYVGGSEHAVLHLLYARFWHMVLHDLGHVDAPEPFRKLFHQGMITSYAYQRKDKQLVAVDAVDSAGTPDEPRFVERETGEPVHQVVAKMSKSLKNVINPDDVIEQFGADTFRLYEMYMGPLEASKPWNTRDIHGLHRFLQRAWRLVIDEDTGEPRLAADADADVERQLHRTIAKAGEDIERLAFNTAIAALIELVNLATGKAAGTGGGDTAPVFTIDQARRFVAILSPFAPHAADEMHARLGGVDHAGSRVETLYLSSWPPFDETQLVDDEVEIAVQLLGKVKARIRVPADADAQRLERIALGHAEIEPLLEGKTVRKVIAVPGRLVNIVAN